MSKGVALRIYVSVLAILNLLEIILYVTSVCFV